MRRFSKADLRTLSSVLAVALLVASVPLTTGVVLVAGPSHAEFTANVCQPIQAFDRVSKIPLARPATIILQCVLCNLAAIVTESPTRIVDYTLGPEPPPPKQSI